VKGEEVEVEMEVVVVMGEGVKEAVVGPVMEVVAVMVEVEMGEGVREEEVMVVVVVVMGEGVREVVEVVVMVEGEKEMKKLKVALEVDKHHPYKNNFHYIDLHNIHNCWGHLKGLYKFHCNMLALNWGIIYCHM
jgi:hypothetical protein